MRYLKNFWLSSLLLTACTTQEPVAIPEANNGWRFDEIPYGLEGSFLKDRKILLENEFKQMGDLYFVSDKDSIQVKHYGNTISFRFFSMDFGVVDTVYQIENIAQEIEFQLWQPFDNHQNLYCR